MTRGQLQIRTRCSIFADASFEFRLEFTSQTVSLTMYSMAFDIISLCPEELQTVLAGFLCSVELKT